MTLLDRAAVFRRIDRSDMLSKAASLGSQCREGFLLGSRWKIPTHFRRARRLLVVGMGGSAIGGDLVRDLLSQKTSSSASSFSPISVSRTYTLPTWVDRKTFVLAISYSGNTEETLTAAKEALQKRLPVAAITSGGELATWGDRFGIPVLSIPPGFPPRSAVGFLTFALLGLLVRLGWVSKAGFPVEKASAAVERFMERFLLPTVPLKKNPAKALARRLKGRLPILYGASGGWAGITYRWRTQLEENAKVLAFHHLFPEATHNEISGWVQPRPILQQTCAIFLTDPAIPSRVRKRIEFTQRVIRAQGALVLPVKATGPDRFTRMLKLLALGDMTSVYLGILYRVDPTPVKRVEALKRFLKGV